MTKFDLLGRIPIEFERHQDREVKPRLYFKVLNVRSLLKLTEIDAAFKAGDQTSLEQLCKFLEEHLVGWENQVDEETGESIEFDRSQFQDLVRFGDLIAIKLGLQEASILSETEQKKLSSSP